MLFAAVRGPVEAFEQRALCGLEPATDAALFSTMGPHPGDLLLAAAAHDHGALLRFFHALTTFEPLAATPVDRLAMGRRLKMEEALACFA